MVLWDCVPTLELNEEEPTEEIQLSSVKVTTRSKGPVMDESSVLPKIKKMQENMKKIISTTQTTSKYNPVNIKETTPVVSKLVKTMVNKIEGTKKGLVEYDMGYDIVEDIKKTKAKISLFELCNFPQQRQKILEVFNPHPNGSQEFVESDKEINEASIGGKSKYQTFNFLLSFEIFNHNVHNCLVDSGVSSNVMSLSVCKNINTILM